MHPKFYKVRINKDIILLVSILFVFIFSFTSNVSVYASSFPVLLVQENTPDSQHSTSKSTPSPEETLLRSQLDTISEYSDKMVNTVYWSLGIVFSVALLIAGFSWYTNFKMYQKDIKDLKESLNNEINQKKTEIDLAIEKDRQKTNDFILDAINDVFEKKITNFDSKIKNLNSYININKQNITEHDARLWDLKDVDENAIRYYFDALELSIENGELRATHLLDKILAMVTNMDSVSTYDVGNFEQILRQLSDKHSVLVKKIHEQIDKKTML